MVVRLRLARFGRKVHLRAVSVNAQLFLQNARVQV